MFIINYNDPFVSEEIHDIPLTPKEYDSFCKGFEPDWDARYSVISIDGWHYIYRSGFWLKKIRYELKPDGLYHIVENYTTEKAKGEQLLVNEVLYTGHFKPSLRNIAIRQMINSPCINYNPKMTGNAQIRYSLIQYGKERTLFVLGLNPSTADEKHGDNTMKKVLGFARHNGYDGFVMLNLYPLRESNPSKLPMVANQKIADQNLKHITAIIKSQQIKTDLLLCFGDNINTRTYLSECFIKIYENIQKYQPNWLQLGYPTQKGNPRHPLYERYDVFEPFDVCAYHKKMKSNKKD